MNLLDWLDTKSGDLIEYFKAKPVAAWLGCSVVSLPFAYVLFKHGLPISWAILSTLVLGFMLSGVVYLLATLLFCLFSVLRGSLSSLSDTTKTIIGVILIIALSKLFEITFSTVNNMLTQIF
jgi:hypothetical protein